MTLIVFYFCLAQLYNARQFCLSQTRDHDDEQPDSLGGVALHFLANLILAFFTLTVDVVNTGSKQIKTQYHHKLMLCYNINYHITYDFLFQIIIIIIS